MYMLGLRSRDLPSPVVSPFDPPPPSLIYTFYCILRCRPWRCKAILALRGAHKNLYQMSNSKPTIVYCQYYTCLSSLTLVTLVTLVLVHA